MKILWVNPHFLHPATQGGQIRTLEMLRQLNRWHEIHYVALEDQSAADGVARSVEYCSKAYPIAHTLPPRGTAWFTLQALGNLIDPLPLAVTRYRSEAMRNEVARLLMSGSFDRLVCDFLFTAPNIPALSQALLFEHKIETTVWERHLEMAESAPARAFYRIQRNRMARYEAEVCRRSAHVVAVSEQDAQRFRTVFKAPRVSKVPTGVDVAAFTPPKSEPPKEQRPEHKTDLVFVGSMDWLPNIDGCNYFVRKILPLIRQQKPDCTIGLVGRAPGSGILEMARADSKVFVSGTVADIRPYFWGSTVSIVPSRIFGGTRLKIFEAMAAQIPVVSTSIGAEGLPVTHGRNIYLADTPEEFARYCLELLDSRQRREQMANEAYGMVAAEFSWEHAARVFEATLAQEAPRPSV